MDKNSDHISICVCTFKRTEQLKSLLLELQKQNTFGIFTYSIVVVDNDSEQSAEQVVEKARKEGSINIEYYNEPEQNISLARNMAVRRSRGEFLAFIDDDELPVNHWLLDLYRTSKGFEADGVLGPVKPYFEANVNPPPWIIKGRLLERKSFPTGTHLTDPRFTRTGNVLFKRRIFDSYENPFDPNLGRTGGEDTDFFKRELAKGRLFIWCDEADVFETVPAARLTREYLLKRALLRGAVRARCNPYDIMGAIKSLVAFIIYSTALPFCFLIGHHHFMKYLIRNCDHIGMLLGILHIKPVNERNF